MFLDGKNIQHILFSESAQKTLPENVHFFDLWKIRGNLGEKVRWSGIHHKTFISIFFYSLINIFAFS
jgi:hypothetical protein